MTKATAPAIQIPKMQRDRMKVKVIGTSPLIIHQFGDKVKKQMLDKQKKKANKGRDAKNPIADFVNSLHLMGSFDREEITEMLMDADVRVGADVAEHFADIPIGFPAGGFKKAAVSACRNVDGVAMTEARGAFFVIEDQGGLVEIKYDRLIIREDGVVISRNTKDIRHRGCLEGWSATLQIELNPMALTSEQVLNLIDISGFSVGVGDWRPERNGSNGMFRLAD